MTCKQRHNTKHQQNTALYNFMNGKALDSKRVDFPVSRDIHTYFNLEMGIDVSAGSSSLLFSLLLSILF